MRSLYPAKGKIGKCLLPVPIRVKEGFGKKRKGQLVFEFVVATLFFLAIVLYSINYLNSSVVVFSAKHHSNLYESNVWQASEVLVKSPGVWSEWVPLEIGLAQKWPVLNEKCTIIGSSQMQYCRLKHPLEILLLNE